MSPVACIKKDSDSLLHFKQWMFSDEAKTPLKELRIWLAEKLFTGKETRNFPTDGKSLPYERGGYTYSCQVLKKESIVGCFREEAFSST